MDEPHDKPAGPLWLPQGSIRAILAFFIVLGALVFQYIDRMDDNMWNLVMLAVSVYFVSRNNAKN